MDMSCPEFTCASKADINPHHPFPLCIVAIWIRERKWIVGLHVPISNVLYILDFV
jgi:hypothetical protein